MVCFIWKGKNKASPQKCWANAAYWLVPLITKKLVGSFFRWWVKERTNQFLGNQGITTSFLHCCFGFSHTSSMSLFLLPMGGSVLFSFCLCFSHHCSVLFSCTAVSAFHIHLSVSLSPTIAESCFLAPLFQLLTYIFLSLFLPLLLSIFSQKAFWEYWPKKKKKPKGEDKNISSTEKNHNRKLLYERLHGEFIVDIIQWKCGLNAY